MIDDYIQSVTSGEVLVGKLERAAVERYVHERAHEPGAWTFSEKRADLAARFFPTCLKHSKGQWGDTGLDNAKPFELSPWQDFCVRNIFGWRHRETGLRRFREVYISVARKNGKTTFIAGLAIYILYADHPVDPAAEVYCTGANKSQAKLLFNEARRMIESSPSLFDEAEIRVTGILNTKNKGTMVPLGLSPQHGSNPSLTIRDELHEWREQHRDLSDAITTGSMARLQPLHITISTAGDPGGKSPIWQEEEEYAAQVIGTALSEAQVDPRYFAFIARPDKGDDLYDPKNFRKANPNLGVSVLESDLLDECQRAVNRPTDRQKWCRFFMNYPKGSVDKAIDVEQWRKGRVDEPELDGCECYAGLDLGTVYDFASFALLFPLAEGNYFLKTWTWASSISDAETDREPWITWQAKGYCEIHEGNAIDFTVIREQIIEILGRYECLGFAFDKRDATVLVQELEQDLGFEAAAFPQSYASYNEPTKLFCSARVPDGEILHDGNPVLEWQADNLIVKRDSYGYWMPDKSHRTRKVDVMAAAIMAYSEALFAENETCKYYDEHPLEVG